MAATLLTLMIDPPSPAAIRGATRAVSRNGPLTLTATTLSNSSSVTSGRLGYSGAMPALFTSTSTFPSSAYVESTSASSPDH